MRFQTLAPLMCALLVTAPACQTRIAQKYPDASLLQRPAEPKLTVDALAADSDKALNDFESAHHAWGRTVASRFDNLCRWFNDMGGSFDCQKLEVPEPPH